MCLFNIRDIIVAISFERAALTARGNPPGPSSGRIGRNTGVDCQRIAERALRRFGFSTLVDQFRVAGI